MAENMSARIVFDGGIIKWRQINIWSYYTATEFLIKTPFDWPTVAELIPVHVIRYCKCDLSVFIFVVAICLILCRSYSNLAIIA